MKNSNGFAVTGILYAILVLFLFLILLILNNFQARKVLFDKQKNVVLEKIDNDGMGTLLEQDFIYNSELEVQEFITPKDGKYKIEVWESGGNAYVSGIVNLYQGIKLYVSLESTGVHKFSNVRTEKNNVNTIILKTRPSGGLSRDNFAYNQDYINSNGVVDDIKIEPVYDVVILDGVNKAPVKSEQAGYCGYVKISFVSELE